MTLIELIIMLVVVVILGSLAYWGITKFFQEPTRTWVLALVGLVFLIIILMQFFPSAGNLRLFGR